MGVTGQIFLWLGFLVGAYASVCRLEVTDAAWQTIPWAAYAAGLAMGYVGVVLLRTEKAIRRRESAASSQNLDGVRIYLGDVTRRVADLAAGVESMTCEDVLALIDDQCVPLLAEFAEGRSVIANRYGASVYAEVMTEFASGERYLNRAWSAAADGYVDEVARSLEAASSFLTAANRTLRAAEA